MDNQPASGTTLEPPAGLAHRHPPATPVSPLAIRRLVQRHPDGADPVFRALLRKPAFSWKRDGEKLLRRHKKTYIDREPTPSISTIGKRLAELIHSAK